MKLVALVLVLGFACAAGAEQGVRADGLTVYGADVLPCVGEAPAPELVAAELQRLSDPSLDPADLADAQEQLLRSQACLTAPATPEIFAAVGASRAPSDDESPATLGLVVPDGADVWLDGETVFVDEVEIGPGRHLVQLGPGGQAPVRSALLEVEAGARVLVSASAAVLLQPKQRGAVAEPPEITFRSSRTAPVFLAVGAGLAAIGGVVTALGASGLDEFNGRVRDGTLSPFPRASAAYPEDYQYYRVWQSHTRDVTVGCALMGIGAGVMVLSIPIGLAHRSTQMGVTASVPLGPDGPQGFALGVVVR